MPKIKKKKATIRGFQLVEKVFFDKLGRLLRMCSDFDETHPSAYKSTAGCVSSESNQKCPKKRAFLCVLYVRALPRTPLKKLFREKVSLKSSKSFARLRSGNFIDSLKAPIRGFLSSVFASSLSRSIIIPRRQPLGSGQSVKIKAYGKSAEYSKAKR